MSNQEKQTEDQPSVPLSASKPKPPKFEPMPKPPKPKPPEPLPDWSVDPKGRYERELSDREELRRHRRRIERQLLVFGLVLVGASLVLAVYLYSKCSLDFKSPGTKGIGSTISWLIGCSNSRGGDVLLLLLGLGLGIIAIVMAIVLPIEGRRSSKASLESLEKRYSIYVQLKPQQNLENYFSALTLINRDNLETYYRLVRTQTDRSFRTSLLAGVAGFVLICVGLVFGVTAVRDREFSTAVLAAVTSGAGIITEFIAAIFFYLYNKTVRQMKDYHDTLIDAQNVFLSLRVIEDLKEKRPDDRVRLLEIIINYLTQPKEKDSKESKK